MSVARVIDAWSIVVRLMKGLVMVSIAAKASDVEANADTRPDRNAGRLLRIAQYASLFGSQN